MVSLVALLRLRYRLLWAHVRSRQGRVAIFALVYLLALCGVGLLSFGGIAAARAAVQLGRPHAIANLALGGVFVYAVVAAVVLGAGVRDAFADGTLRRYPLSTPLRVAGRHLVTLLEPTWIVVLAVDTGLAIGFHDARGGSLWLALAASVLLVLVNYLAARIVVGVGERVLATGAGALAATITVGLLPFAALAGWDRASAAIGQRPWLLDAGQSILTILPPGAAASVITAPSSRAAAWPLMLLAVWAVALGAVLAALDRRPVGASRTAHADPAWDTGYDRVGAWFGPELGPLVGKMLRCYVRCPQVRQNLAIIPVVLVQTLLMTHLQKEGVAIAGMTLVGMSAGGLSTNVFGFDGSGFRRYWVLPLTPRTILLAAAVVALVPGALLLPVVLAAIAVVAPPLAEPRTLALLAASGIAGLLVYQGVGLWTSVLAPRPIPFYSGWGTRLSFGAGATMAGSIVVFFLLTWRFLRTRPEALRSHWWLALPVVVMAALFWAASVWAGSAVLAARRERLVAAVEGLD
jgi:hypothetical protein